MEEPCDADVYDAQDEETYPIYGRMNSGIRPRMVSMAILIGLI